jgi:hypothetical protein
MISASEYNPLATVKWQYLFNEIAQSNKSERIRFSLFIIQDNAIIKLTNSTIEKWSVFS